MLKITNRGRMHHLRLMLDGIWVNHENLHLKLAIREDDCLLRSIINGQSFLFGLIGGARYQDIHPSQVELEIHCQNGISITGIWPNLKIMFHGKSEIEDRPLGQVCSLELRDDLRGRGEDAFTHLVLDMAIPNLYDGKINVRHGL